MERTELLAKLTLIFKTVFKNDSIVLTNELTANDVEKWDSLSNMILITNIEKTFSIKFRLKDLSKMRNVGELIDVINSKL